MKAFRDLLVCQVITGIAIHVLPEPSWSTAMRAAFALSLSAVSIYVFFKESK